MNVKELREQMAGMPDNAIVLIGDESHGYYKAGVWAKTALLKGSIYTEDIYVSNEIGEVTPNGARVAALCIE